MQEVCNMVAKATNESHASPVKLKKSTSKDVYEPWDMTEREKEVTTKYIKLIQGRIPNKQEPIVLSDVSPGEDTLGDLTTSMMSSVVSSSSQESVLPRLCDYEQVTFFLVCLKRPVAVVSASMRYTACIGEILFFSVYITPITAAAQAACSVHTLMITTGLSKEECYLTLKTLKSVPITWKLIL